MSGQYSSTRTLDSAAASERQCTQGCAYTTTLCLILGSCAIYFHCYLLHNLVSSLSYIGQFSKVGQAGAVISLVLLFIPCLTLSLWSYFKVTRTNSGKVPWYLSADSVEIIGYRAALLHYCVQQQSSSLSSSATSAEQSSHSSAAANSNINNNTHIAIDSSEPTRPPPPPLELYDLSLEEEVTLEWPEGCRGPAGTALNPGGSAPPPPSSSGGTSATTAVMMTTVGGSTTITQQQSRQRRVLPTATQLSLAAERLHRDRSFEPGHQSPILGFLEVRLCRCVGCMQPVPRVGGGEGGVHIDGNGGEVEDVVPKVNGVVKVAGVHHCSSCSQCVEDMDHHCPWIGQCVGRQNHKFFLLFLLYTALLSLFTGVTMVRDVVSGDYSFIGVMKGTLAPGQASSSSSPPSSNSSTSAPPPGTSSSSSNAKDGVCSYLIMIGFVSSVMFFLTLMPFFYTSISNIAAGETTIMRMQKRRRDLQQQHQTRSSVVAGTSPPSINNNGGSSSSTTGVPIPSLPPPPASAANGVVNGDDDCDEEDGRGGTSVRRKASSEESEPLLLIPAVRQNGPSGSSREAGGAFVVMADGVDDDHSQANSTVAASASPSPPYISSIPSPSIVAPLNAPDANGEEDDGGVDDAEEEMGSLYYLSHIFGPVSKQPYGYVSWALPLDPVFDEVRDRRRWRRVIAETVIEKLRKYEE